MAVCQVRAGAVKQCRVSPATVLVVQRDGPLVAAADSEGYVTSGIDASAAIPYHGYFYKMLNRQGEHAPGGAVDYVVSGRKLFGFALLAYPAEYGSSGIMTFMVGTEGVVYQKDLGENTEKMAPRLDSYDPDPSWRAVDEK